MLSASNVVCSVFQRESVQLYYTLPAAPLPSTIWGPVIGSKNHCARLFSCYLSFSVPLRTHMDTHIHSQRNPYEHVTYTCTQLRKNHRNEGSIPTLVERKQHKIPSLFSIISQPWCKVWLGQGSKHKSLKCSNSLSWFVWMQNKSRQNVCGSMWPSNLTAGSSIWSPQHHPPQINSPRRIHRGTEEELRRGGGGAACEWFRPLL